MASELCINGPKSVIIQSGNVGSDFREISLLFGVGYKQMDEGLTYLGFKLRPKKHYNKDWDWLVERFHKRLDYWKHIWLIMGGRLTILKVVLQNKTVYWMHLFLLQKEIIKRIQSIMGLFI